VTAGSGEGLFPNLIVLPLLYGHPDYKIDDLYSTLNACIDDKIMKEEKPNRTEFDRVKEIGK